MQNDRAIETRAGSRPSFFLSSPKSIPGFVYSIHGNKGCVVLVTRGGLDLPFSGPLQNLILGLFIQIMEIKECAVALLLLVAAFRFASFPHFFSVFFIEQTVAAVGGPAKYA